MHDLLITSQYIEKYLFRPCDTQKEITEDKLVKNNVLSVQYSGGHMKHLFGWIRNAQESIIHFIHTDAGL